MLQREVDLIDLDESEYIGTIYLGSPNSQPVRVVFDTGSEYLAVTSNLCSNKKMNSFLYSEYSNDVADALKD